MPRPARHAVYLSASTSFRVTSLLHSVVKSPGFSPALSNGTVVQVTPTLAACQSPSGIQTPKLAVDCGGNQTPLESQQFGQKGFITTAAC